jgi:hypothetical protein
VHGESDSQRISCSTVGSKNTKGLQFFAHTKIGTIHGYRDIAYLLALKIKVVTSMMEKPIERLTNRKEKKLTMEYAMPKFPRTLS